MLENICDDIDLNELNEDDCENDLFEIEICSDDLYKVVGLLIIHFGYTLDKNIEYVDEDELINS